MKKGKILLITGLSLILINNIDSVSCNMAAPKRTDIASSITFEKNNDISVTKEHLTITIDDQIAHINALYTMKNTKNEEISTPSMFVSPNIENYNTKVLFNEVNLDYSKQTYYINYSTELSNNEWEYALLDESNENNSKFKVDTIKFDLNFLPMEEANVSVNYDYRLGGRPERNDNYKYGELNYYIKPVGLWKDFNNLTIDLYLDDNLPVLENSNYSFKNIQNNHSQCILDTLPEKDLYIKLDQTGFQSFIGTFRNPYLPSMLMMYSILFLPIILIVIIIVVLFVYNHKKNKKI